MREKRHADDYMGHVTSCIPVQHLEMPVH